MLPGGFERWLPLVAVTTAMGPTALLMIRALDSRARRRGVPDDRGLRASISEVGMVVGTLPWVWLALTPMPAPGAVRMVPLRDLTDQLAGAPVTAFFQVAGNLLLLAAFGFCAAARWRIAVPGIAALAAALSLTVESLQYALALGRVCSVDDVLLNTTGAALAALIARRCWPRSGDGRRAA